MIEFDPAGNMQSIVRSERGWSHRLIEEFMLRRERVRGDVD